MTRIAINGSLLFVTVAGLVSAADSLSGPVAGYIAGSPKAELRAILGVPGSFLFSDPLSLPDGISIIRMAPGQDFALVERRRGGAAAMVLGGGAVDHVTPLEGVMATAGWAVFSLGGRSAVLCSSTSDRLQVVTGLPDAPQLALDLDAALFPEPPVTAALSDDGSLVLVASSRSVYLLSQAATPQLLMSGGRIGALAVLRNGKDAVAVDRSTGSVHLLEGAASAPTPRVLVSGLDEPGQVFPSPDGKTLFLATPGRLTVSWIDLASGEVHPSEPPGADAVAPVDLMPLRSRDTFLISARPRQPAWIFYRDGNVGHVVFVPAVSTKESVR